MDYATLNLLFRFGKEFSHKKIRVKDFSDTEYMICSYVYSHAGCSQEDVTAALRMDKTTVGKAIASLEEKHCIGRTQDTADRRRKKLCLTGEGREKTAGLLNIHNDWLSEILTCLSPGEQAQFEDFCRRLLTAAEELAENNKTGGNQNAQ